MAEQFTFGVDAAAEIDVYFDIRYPELPDPEDDVVTLSVSNITVLGKVASTGLIPVVLSEALAYDLYIPYSTVDSDPTATATVAVDYTSTSSSVTIPAGELNGNLSVPILAEAGGTPSTISFINKKSYSTNTDVSSYSIELPVGVQVGDLLVAIHQTQGNGNWTSTPAGWTTVYDQRSDPGNSNSGCHVMIQTKVATASEPADYDYVYGTGADFAAVILAYRGAASLSDPEAGDTLTATDITSIVAPTVTTTAANSVLITVAACNPSTTGSNQSFSTPTSMTERYDSNLTGSGTTLRAGLGVFEQAIAAAGATGTRTSTASNNGQAVAINMFLTPVASQPVTEGTEFFFVELGVPKVTNSGGAVADIIVAKATGKVTIVPDADVDPPDPPDGDTGNGIMVGWHQRNNDASTLVAHEGHLGQKFAVVRMFGPEDEDHPEAFVYPSAQAQELGEGGRLVVWSVKRPDWVLTASGDDAEDAWIDEVGSILQSWDVPTVVFCFYHEPHDNSDQKDKGTTRADNIAAGRTATAFKAVYARINDLWGAAGYLKRDAAGGKILIGYCAVDEWALGEGTDQYGLPGTLGTDALYPASGDVDILCHDSYNTISGVPNKLFGHTSPPSGTTESWYRILDECCDVQNKPLIIGEWGSKPGDVYASALKTALGGTRDRDEWFRNAAAFMLTEPLAQEWLKGFCYFHSRRWMFMDDDGTKHPSGEADVAGDGTPVEGKDGWIDAFVGVDGFTSVQFNPISSTPDVPPETPSACDGTWTSQYRADAVPSGNGEISGLAASKVHSTVMWAIRDSAGPHALLRLKTTGTTGVYSVREIDIPGTTNADWEDCFYSAEPDGNFIYIHDNRDGNGDGLNPRRLYKVLEPANPDTDTSTTLVATYYWKFPPEATTNICKQDGHPDNNQNCEAMFMYPVNNGGNDGVIYAVQKGKGSADVYRLGKPSELKTSSSNPTIGVKVGKIDHSCPSSFAINVAGDRAISVSHNKHTVWKGVAGDLSSLLSGKASKATADVSPGLGGQDEAADWFPHGSCNFQVMSETRQGWLYTN